jgi:hypothetical protein
MCRCGAPACWFRTARAGSRPRTRGPPKRLPPGPDAAADVQRQSSRDFTERRVHASERRCRSATESTSGPTGSTQEALRGFGRARVPRSGRVSGATPRAPETARIGMNVRSFEENALPEARRFWRPEAAVLRTRRGPPRWWPPLPSEAGCGLRQDATASGFSSGRDRRVPYRTGVETQAPAPQAAAHLQQLSQRR